MEEKVQIFAENKKYLVRLKMNNIQILEEMTVLKIIDGKYVRVFREKNGPEWILLDWLESNTKVMHEFPDRKLNFTGKIKLWIIKKLAK